MVACPRRQRESRQRESRLRESRLRVTFGRVPLRRHPVVASEGQTHGAACATLQCAMDRAGVAHKVRTSPWMSLEKIVWEHAALETITGTAGRHEIAGIVRPAAGQWHDMVKGGAAMIETQRAVHAALSAVAQGRAAHSLFRRHMGRYLWPK